MASEKSSEITFTLDTLLAEINSLVKHRGSPIAQLVERGTCDRLVAGSHPGFKASRPLSHRGTLSSGVLDGLKGQ